MAIAPKWAEIGRLVLARILAINILVVVNRIQKVDRPLVSDLRWRIGDALSLAHLGLYRVEKTSVAHRS